MIREKHILTDADGCLLNWNDAFTAYMLSKGYPMIEGGDTHYSISGRHGVVMEDAIKLIREFNEGPAIKYLTPLPDAVKYVTKLRAEGFRFTVVTALSDVPIAKQYRTKNLNAIFGPIFDEVICIKMGGLKTEELSRWRNSGFFWIEDHPGQAEAGHNVGLRPLLIKHPYNEEYHNNDGFPIVQANTAWEEIYDIVMKDYNL